MSIQKPLTLDQVIEDSIASCYPDDWSEENFITRTWLKALRDNFARRRLDYAWGSCLFDCQKLTGAHEKSHGDIGILVRLTSSSGESVLGLASMEAKRSYEDESFENKYLQLDIDQLKREGARTLHHRLLLYSHSPIPKFSQLRETSAVVLPSELGIVFHQDTLALESVGIRLSTQIARYLQGWDLDFSKDTVSKVLYGDRRFSFLMKAHVALGQDIPLSIESLKIRGVEYTDIDGPDQGIDHEPVSPYRPTPPPPRHDGPRMGGGM